MTFFWLCFWANEASIYYLPSNKAGDRIWLGFFYYSNSKQLSMLWKNQCGDAERKGLEGHRGTGQELNVFSVWPLHICRKVMSCMHIIISVHIISFFSHCILHPCVLFMFVLPVKSHLIKGVGQWKYSSSHKMNEHPLMKCCICISLICFQYLIKKNKTVKLYLQGLMITVQGTLWKIQIQHSNFTIHVLILCKVVLHTTKILLWESKIRGH